MNNKLGTEQNARVSISNGMKSIGKFIGISLLQALGAGLIVWIWGVLMTNMQQLANVGGDQSISGFLIIPMVFIIVAVLSAGAVLGYPIYLIFNQKWGIAIGLILLTLVWLGLFSAILIYLF
jgi:hypothetical protein